MAGLATGAAVTNGLTFAAGSASNSSLSLIIPGLSLKRGLRTSWRQRGALKVSSKEGDSEPDETDLNQDEKGPIDWDKAWSSFPKPKERGGAFFNFKLLFKMDMEKYVNRRPNHSKFPLSEEVDPLRRSERSALNAWTDPRFTVAGVGVIVGLFVYMVIIVGPPPV